jgi:hypothetical protein
MVLNLNLGSDGGIWIVTNSDGTGMLPVRVACACCVSVLRGVSVYVAVRDAVCLRCACCCVLNECCEYMATVLDKC